MLPLLVPPPVDSRVFPEVGPELYQRMPPGIEAIAGLLQGAMEAESLRLSRRADFFWRKLHRSVRKRSIEPGESFDGSRFATEVLIETHCAFYNGWVESGGSRDPRHRAFAHLDYVWQLVDLDLSSLTKIDEAALLCPATLARANLWLEMGSPASAKPEVEKLLERYPGNVEVLECLITLHVAETHSKLVGGETEATNLADAKTLKEGLWPLQTLRRDYPDDLGLYQAIGHLYHLRAVKFANTRDLARALEQVQRALTYDPWLKEAKKTRSQLVKLMKELQKEVRKAESALASGPPGFTMTEEGRKLQRQAEIGFDLRESWSKCSFAKRIAEQRQQAEARWLKAGKAEYEALADEETEAQRESAPRLEISGERIARRDFEPLVPWLRSQQDLLIKIPAAAAVLLLLLTGSLAWRESHNREARSVLYAQTLEAADRGDVERVIDHVDAFRSRALLTGDVRRERYLDRLYREATELKTRIEGDEVLRQLVMLASHDAMAVRRIRDQAYKKLRMAFAEQNYLQAVESAERYLATPFLGASDKREAAVHRLYNEAFVRWFVAQGDDLGHQHIHIDRFRSLTHV